MQTQDKEFNIQQSVKLVKDMLKDKSLKKSRDTLKAGDLFFGTYDAKNKENVYDKRPFIILLKQNKTHILGLNFHYLPLKFRSTLIKAILKVNANNIKNKKRLEFSYEDFKPFLRKFGYSPCIRLYIRNRMSSTVIKIKSEDLMQSSKLNTAVFTNGISSETLYKKAIQNK
mgnify:CR=1 FL=1